MSARTSRTLAAIVAATMAITVAGVTASSASAAGTCAPGEIPGVQAGDGIGPLQISRGATGYVNVTGSAYGSADNFAASASGLGSATQPGVTVTTRSGPPDATVGSASASGVTATGQDLNVGALPTVGHASVQISHVTGPAGSTAFTDPAAARTALGAAGANLAAALTASLPGVQAALAGDPSPQAAAFIAAVQAAATAAPTASTTILDGPAFTVTGLFGTFTATEFEAMASTSVGSVTVGGVLTGAGFLAGGSIDLVDGEGVNAVLTDNTPTWTLLGLPVVETGVINTETVDVSSLNTGVQAAVQTALASVPAALQQLTHDAGLFAGAFPGGTWPSNPGFLRSTSLAVNLGGGDNASSVVLGGSTVQTACYAPPVDTRLTPAPDSMTVEAGMPVTLTVKANDLATIAGVVMPAVDVPGRLTYAVATRPALGSATFGPGGLTYVAGSTPGTDNFSYRVSYTDGVSGVTVTGEASVTMTIVPSSIPNPTPTPTPSPTATPTPTPTATPTPTPSPTADPVVKDAPRPHVITTNTPAAG